MEKIKNMKDLEFHVRVPRGVSKEELLKALTEAVERKMEFEFESADERIRSALLRGFNSMLANQPIGTFYGEPIKDIIAYLEKQKEQKPAEWSDEDEKMYQTLIHNLGVICEKVYPHNIHLKKELNWLKSPRPQSQWKPLPESMGALLYAIEGKWDNIKPTSYFSRRLEDLYDGLVNTYNVDENSEYIYPEDKK